MFVDLQGFIVRKKFVVKIGAVLRKGGHSLSLNFYVSHANGISWQSQKNVALPD